jgi:hypothetical protein
MPIYHDGKKMKPYRGYRKPVNVYYGDKKVAGWKNSTQTGNNLTFQTTYNDTADVVVKGKSLQKSEWHKAEAQSTQSNPMINRVPEHMRKFEGWSAYQGASVTLTQNISVSEWGTDEATRIQTTGGSTTTKYYYGISAVIWGGPLSDGRKTQILVDVKNIGTAQVIISCNLGNDVAVNPGETKSVTVNGTGNGSKYWMFAFQALSASDNLDFIAYNPRAYILDEIPLPDNPFPIQTTIQAGTYKVQDYKGDWWEFTLTEDLCGIGEVRDAVEFDKYSHKGFLRKKTGKVVFDGSADEPWGDQSTAYPTPNTMLFAINGLVGRKGYDSVGFTGVADISSHFVNPKQSLQVTTYDNEAAIGHLNDRYSTFYYVRINKTRLSTQDLSGFRSWLAANPVTVVYQLATSTRTPLIFTKNNSSTAPECPMEFLTDTPSGEYPATVWDASGTVKARGKNLLPFPLDLETYTVEHNGSPPITSSTQTDEFVRIQGAEEEIDTAFRIVSPMFPLNPNTTYTISFKAYVDSPTFTLWDMVSPWGWCVALLSQSGVQLSQQQHLYTVQKEWITYKFVATTNEEGLFYLRLGSDWPNLINGFILIDRHSIQIELGSTATSYEPYRPEVSAPIPPLRKIGDVADTYNPVTGEYVQRIGVKVFDGTEPIDLPIQTPPVGYNAYRYLELMNSARPPYICSHYPYNNEQGYTQPIDKEYIKSYTLNEGQMFFLTYLSRCPDVNSFKAYLAAQYAAGTPVTVYYQLAEPVVTYLDPVTLPTYYPTTVITTTNNTAAELGTTAVVKVEE